MAKTLNEKPFEHRARNGTVFRAERCDFVDGVTAHVPRRLSPAQMMADAVELGAWHCANIVPQLNGFTGPPEVHVVRKTFKAASVLKTPLLEFFSEDRLKEFGNKTTPRRTYNALYNERVERASGALRLPPIETVGTFLQHMTRMELRRIPNFGDKGIELIERVLEASNLELRA